MNLELQGKKQKDFDGEKANDNDAVGDILTNIENIGGSLHDDWLTGDDGDNWLLGDKGDDILDGGAGGDILKGGAGNDDLDGGEGDDNLVGGWGDDQVDGGEGADTLDGGEGVDTLDGGAGADVLEGGEGNDHLTGGTGADEINGGEGTDYADYRNAEAGVRVSLELQGEGQEDFDGTHGFAANENEAVGDTLTNIEVLEGSAHDDWLTGDGDANWLVGNGGNDRLEGGGGGDTLYGLDGDDTLEGGAGTDTYFFRIGDGTDTITDIATEGDDVMFLQFRGLYEAEDFDSSVFERVGDDLVISLDLQPDDGIEDKITIENAYDSNPDTGTGEAAFTISISYGHGNDDFLAVTDIWSDLIV